MIAVMDSWDIITILIFGLIAQSDISSSITYPETGASVWTQVGGFILNIQVTYCILFIFIFTLVFKIACTILHLYI